MCVSVCVNGLHLHTALQFCLPFTHTHTRRATRGSVSCSKTLQHSGRESRGSNHKPWDRWTTLATSWATATANERQEGCVYVCVYSSLFKNQKNGERPLCWVIVTWLTRCLLRVTAAALLIACLRWMMGYLIPTHSTQLLFTLAGAWGGSGGFLWPYGEGGRVQAEWSGAYRLIPAPDWLLYCTEAADGHMTLHD